MLKRAIQNQFKKLTPVTQLNLGIKGFSIFKLPLLAFCWPTIQKVDLDCAEVVIPLSSRTQNHLGVMYFGALSIGAELVISLHVLDEIRKEGMIEFIFKDFHAEFLKRAAGDVKFVCQEGEAIRALVQKARVSKQRETATFKAYALTEKQTGNDPIAEFSLTLSLKQKT